MPNLIEQAQWEAGIYQLETTDPVVGGPDGVDNLPHKLLGNRTAYLRAQLPGAGITDYMRTLLDDADAATARATLAAQPSLGYTPVDRAGDTMAGPLTLPGDPTAPLHASPKQYVDTMRALPGEIRMYGGSSAPSGWLLCEGSAVSRTTYAALFAVLGTTYGAGDGSTTFNVPDARGRALIGAGQGSGLSGRVLGATGGAETHTLTTAEMPTHQHRTFSSWGTTGYQVIDPASDMGRRKNHPDDNNSSVDLNSEVTGGGSAHNNMPPFLVLNVIIKT